jgi:hypothetical protein
MWAYGFTTCLDQYHCFVLITSILVLPSMMTWDVMFASVTALLGIPFKVPRAFVVPVDAPSSLVAKQSLQVCPLSVEIISRH